MVGPQATIPKVLDGAVAEIHQDLDRRAQEILHLAARVPKASDRARAKDYQMVRTSSICSY